MELRAVYDTRGGLYAHGVEKSDETLRAPLTCRSHSGVMRKMLN